MNYHHIDMERAAFIHLIEDGSINVSVKNPDRDFRKGDRVVLKEAVPSELHNGSFYTGRESIADIADAHMTGEYLCIKLVVR